MTQSLGCGSSNIFTVVTGSVWDQSPEPKVWPGGGWGVWVFIENLTRKGVGLGYDISLSLLTKLTLSSYQSSKLLDFQILTYLQVFVYDNLKQFSQQNLT